jgi:tRNA 2-selenouridine synthase
MKQIVSIDFFFSTLAHLPVIDVRSPGEYLKGHIPGACNVALFSNEERAIVGTAYKHEGKGKAMELGLEFVTPKLESFISDASRIAPERKVVVHCWRGGMRSGSFAQHLHEHGFHSVYIIEGGYKAFRNYVLRYFERPFQLKILGGYTGSGKTEILHCMSDQGYQVVDLEGLANHRGSAFGGIDLPDQPTTEQFENNLFDALRQLSHEKPIWLEDESNGIGKVNIPKPFFKQMRNQPLYFLHIPQQERAKHLVDTYADLDPIGLRESIEKIATRLGLDKTKLALSALDKGDFRLVAELVLVYYDKYYLKGLLQHDQDTVFEIKAPTTHHERNAKLVLNA